MRKKRNNQIIPGTILRPPVKNQYQSHTIFKGIDSFRNIKIYSSSFFPMVIKSKTITPD